MNKRLVALACLLLAACGSKGPDVHLERHDALSRAEFNRWALRQDLSMFWVADANHDGQLQPAELSALLFFPDDGPWVQEGAFSPRFEQAYATLVAASKAAAAGGSTADERQQLVGQDLDQGRSSLVATDLATLTPGEQQFVDHMLKVAKVTDDLFARENGSAALAARLPADDPASRSLFRRNWGPECVAPRTEKNPACSAIPGAPRRLVDVYPADLQEDAGFCAQLDKRADARTLLTPFSVVREQGGQLVAQSFAKAYGEPMQAIATELEAAAAALDPASERALIAYLKAAAGGFRSNDWLKADEAWSRMTVANSRWYVRVAPDETYWEPCSRKAAFHLTLALVDKGSLEWQAKLAPHQNDMEKRLAAVAGAPYRARKVSFHLPDFIQIVVNAGFDRMPLGGVAGESLPNWGPVANEGRGRTMAVTNLSRDPDSLAARRSQLASLFDAATLAGYSDDGQGELLDTILPEATHNLGPAHEYKVQGRADGEVFGGPVASMMEELKAEAGALYFLEPLRQLKLISDDEALRGYTHVVAWSLGHISQGMYAGTGQRKTYGNVAAIIVGFLMDQGALTWEPAGAAANGSDHGVLVLHPDKVVAAGDALMKQVAGIKARGDSAGAQALLSRYVDSGEVVPHAVISERMLREPKASFVYAIRR